MNPSKVSRDRLETLTDLPNIGPAMARDLRLLGFDHPAQLAGQDPQALYDRLGDLTGVRQDPCVLDVLVSVTRFMDGEEPRPWWHYTPERKKRPGT
ncbi:Pathogenicity locus [anaerobic digester metagenome]